MAKLRPNRDDTMQFRLSAPERMFIEMAAAGKNLQPSVYLRRSAIKQAEMDLADSVDYGVSEEEMAAFLSALDEPAVSKPKLKELLNEKTILE